MSDLDGIRRQLEAKIESAFTKVQQVEHSTAELREKRARNAEQLTDEQVEALRASILARERTPEWQRVIERIAVGDFTWRHIAVSYFSGKMEPSIKLAFDSLDNVPALTPEQRERINAELESKFESKDDESNPRSLESESSSGLAGEQHSASRHPEPDDWDDDFDTTSFIR